MWRDHRPHPRHCVISKGIWDNHNMLWPSIQSLHLWKKAGGEVQYKERGDRKGSTLYHKTRQNIGLCVTVEWMSWPLLWKQSYQFVFILILYVWTDVQLLTLSFTSLIQYFLLRGHRPSAQRPIDHLLFNTIKQAAAFLWHPLSPDEKVRRPNTTHVQQKVLCLNVFSAKCSIRSINKSEPTIHTSKFMHSHMLPYCTVGPRCQKLFFSFCYLSLYN